MRICRFKAFVLFSIVFLALSGWSVENGGEENSSEQKWNIRDLDATHIRLEDIRKVAYGKYPRWSPDSKKILYTEAGTLNGGIWMINPDGSNEKEITKDGFLAAWSPDGKRIVYTYTGYYSTIEAIAIVDLEAKKESIIWKKERAGIFHKVFNLRIEWIKDEKIFFFNEGWSNRTDLIIMNLDDLSIETERPATYEHAATGNKNLAHPLFNIYLEKEYSDPLIHLDFANYIPLDLQLNYDQKKKLWGIWAENKKGTPFAIRLLGPLFAEFSPDLTKLLFESKDDIYVAKISKSPISRIKHYEVPLGLKDGLKKKDILIVSTPKINPLNNKLIGHNEKELKGTVIVESVEEDKALVRTLLLIEDFKHNYVAVKGTSFGYIKEISMEEKTIEVKVIPKIIATLKEAKPIYPEKAISKTDAIKLLRPITLVEQIPYEKVIEIVQFKETEFYDSMNKFIGAEIVIRVRFAAHIEPAERLPLEYKDGLKRAYSNVDIYVKEIPSKEALEKMMEALADNKYLELIEDKEIQAFLYETKLNNEKVKRIEKIFLKPESFFFVKY